MPCHKSQSSVTPRPSLDGLTLKIYSSFSLFFVMFRNVTRNQCSTSVRWNAVCVCVCARACAQSCLTLCNPMNCIACQALLSLEFSRQEQWIGLTLLTPGDLSDPGIEPTSPVSPALADSLPLATPGEPGTLVIFSKIWNLCFQGKYRVRLLRAYDHNFFIN